MKYFKYFIRAKRAKPNEHVANAKLLRQQKKKRKHGFFLLEHCLDSTLLSA